MYGGWVTRGSKWVNALGMGGGIGEMGKCIGEWVTRGSK